MSDGNEKIYNFKSRSDDAGLVCHDPSRTVQADAVDADINTIVRRFNLTGRMPENLRVPQYGDYDDVFDFHSAQMKIAEATEAFMSMPADIRAEFNNDPGRFYDIASNPENIDYLRDLGLAIPKEDVILPVPVVDGE